MFALACAMHEQGFSSADILTELESADVDWGSKFAKRPDGKKRLWELVVSAQRTIRGVSG